MEEAANGREALDAVRRSPPDLVLLDLAMPVLDGMTFLQKLYATEPRPRTRVVVMTAHGSVRAAVEAVRLGASDFLEKPLTPDDLRLSVAGVLDERLPAALEAGPAYDDVLRFVRQALHAGRFAEAEALLMKAGTIADSDPAFLNLAGVLHESHGRRASARRFYEKAAAADLNYGPARENLRRLHELHVYGQSKMDVALGDEQELLEGFRGRLGRSHLDQLRAISQKWAME